MNIKSCLSIILFSFSMAACHPTTSSIPTLILSSSETAIFSPTIYTPSSNKATNSPTIFLPTASFTATLTTVPDISHMTIGSPIEFSWIEMIDARTGWAVGGPYGGHYSTHILKTQDGGQSWSDVTPRDGKTIGNSPLMGFAINNKLMWVVEQSSSQLLFVWKTIDGGKTWSKTSLKQSLPNEYYPIFLTFVNSNYGWLMNALGVGGGDEFVDLYRTTDGGMHWNEITFDGDLDIHDGGKQGLVFADELHGWYIADINGQWPKMGFTTNGGMSWQEIDLQAIIGNKSFYMENQPCDIAMPVIRGNRGITGISCHTYDETGYTVAYLLMFNNSGTDWIFRKYPGGDLYSVDGIRIWAIDYRYKHCIYRSDDAGKSWKMISAINFIRRIDFVSSQLGWALENTGINYSDGFWLAHTEDGGESWTRMEPVIVA